MINANEEIKSILTGLDFSVVYSRPQSFTKLPAVSYYNLTESGGFYSDNSECIRDVTMQLDVWAKDINECTRICDDVNKRLLRNGYYRQMSMDVPSEADGVYHRTMRFIKQFILQEEKSE